jgi:Cys-tRNA(Pro)/Cys-tRNA(Cys) deacylase
MIKTNAVRVLDRLGIRYELREYEVDPHDLSAGTVAAKTGMPPEQLFKTLAVQGDRNGIYLPVIPATEELDFKALARQTGDRKVDMVPLKEVQTATGYVRGGVTALACKKDYPVFIDELPQICDLISVSAGMRGLQVLLAPEDYIRAVKARGRSYYKRRSKLPLITLSFALLGRITSPQLPADDGALGSNGYLNSIEETLSVLSKSRRS